MLILSGRDIVSRAIDKGKYGKEDNLNHLPSDLVIAWSRIHRARSNRLFFLLLQIIHEKGQHDKDKTADHAAKQDIYPFSGRYRIQGGSWFLH